MSEADAIINQLGLRPHPEGGWYVETWRAAETTNGRAVGTAIYFLLKAGERSHWHRVDAAEAWLWHKGAPLTLRMAETAQGPAAAYTLGPDISSDQNPQLIVPPTYWQAAETSGAFTLVSCIVTPGFRFEGFELAPETFDIPGA